jgi:hypothetical protein
MIARPHSPVSERTLHSAAGAAELGFLLYVSSHPELVSGSKTGCRIKFGMTGKARSRCLVFMPVHQNTLSIPPLERRNESKGNRIVKNV